MSGHTKGEIVGAFKAAASILEEVVSMGFESPYFEIFVDGSATLWISDRKDEARIEHHWERLTSLVYSNRIRMNRERIGITTCEGLFQYANSNPRPL
jgi:hypothetical protein